MSDQTTALKISADASGVEAGVSTAKRSLATLGAAAKSVGDSVGKGMAPIGDGADGAAKKVDSATKSIIGSIQRTTALMEAGERGSAKYYEALGAQRGVSVDALKPYIAQLEAVKEKQAQAAAAMATGSVSLGKVEISARATSAALRGVPAQFTDIITSLQGGQAPMTVLLQQGGQLKDMFGGAGNAAKALGGYVVGLVNPFTATAAAAAAVGLAYYKGAQEIKAFETSLALSGNASGVTVDTMRQLAAATGGSADALAQFARAGATGAEGLQKFSEAAARFEHYTGIAVKDSVAAWKSLGDEPVKSALKLNETISFLTPTIYRQIKALQDQGKAFEASALAQDAFARAQERISSGAESKLSAVSFGWDRIAKSIGGAWKALKEFTNGDSVDKRIGASQATIENATKGLELARSRGEDGRVAQYQKIIDAETKHLFMLQSGLSVEKGVSAEKSEQNKRLDAQSALDREHDKYLSKTVERERELAKVRQDTALANKGLQAIVDYGGAGADTARKTLLENQKKLAESEAGIRKKYSETGAAAKPDAWITDVSKAYTKALEDLDKVQISASASADKLSKTQEILRSVQASPEWASFSRRKQEEVIMAASLAQAEEDRRAALEASKKAQDAYNASARESANSIANKLEALGDETRAYSIATEKNISLAEAIQLVAVARLEDEVIRAKIADNYTGVKELEREIEKRKELARELGKKADNTAMVDAGKKAAAETLAEWKRGWEETDRLARDVFTTWATDGSNAAQKIGDTLKKALLSAIYEATLKPVVLEIYTSVTGGKTGSASGLAGLGSKALDWITGGSGGTGGNADKSVIYGGTGYGVTGTEAAGGMFGSFGGAGAFVKQVLPWIGGLAMLKSLTDYKIDAKGNGITATVGGASGLPSGKVGTFAEFQQTGGLGGGGVTTNRDWGVADQGVADYITGNVQAITAANKAYGAALGLTSDKIDAFTKNIEINTTGLDAAGQKAAIDAELVKFAAEQSASVYKDALSGVAVSGEDTSTTLARLATSLVTTNDAMASFGGALYDVGVTGAASASQLVAAFGSVQAMQAQFSQAISNYATPEQQRAMAFGAGAADLGKVGINVTAADLQGMTREQVAQSLAGYQQAAAATGATKADQDRLAAAVTVANRLTAFVPAFQSAAAAPASVASAGGSGGGGGGGSSSTAANEISSAWKSITDSIWGEVKRIRGLIEGTGEDAFAAAQTRFSIATAQARAGDQEAAKALPELSQNLLTLGETNAQTLLQLRLLQGQTAASLTTTGSILSAGFGLTVPSVGVGSIPIPQASAPVYSPAYNPVLSSGGAGNDSATAAALRALADRLDLIEANTRAGAQHGAALSRQITRLVPDGDALEVRVVV